jgi:hypothetical protein
MIVIGSRKAKAFAMISTWTMRGVRPSGCGTCCRPCGGGTIFPATSLAAVNVLRASC